jgi:mono/diheme cytochrome c family protein
MNGPAQMRTAIAALLALLAFAPFVARADSEADMIARGQYVTRAADCDACHTGPGGVSFTGGRPFKLPFGVLYAPNITPDETTGIAGYSYDDWVRMLHDGEPFLSFLSGWFAAAKPDFSRHRCVFR